MLVPFSLSITTGFYVTAKKAFGFLSVKCSYTWGKKKTWHVPQADFRQHKGYKPSHFLISITALLFNLWPNSSFLLPPSSIKVKTTIQFYGAVKKAERKTKTCNCKGTKWLPGTVIIIHHFLTFAFKTFKSILWLDWKKQCFWKPFFPSFFALRIFGVIFKNWF